MAARKAKIASVKKPAGERGRTWRTLTGRQLSPGAMNRMVTNLLTKTPVQPESTPVKIGPRGKWKGRAYERRIEPHSPMTEHEYSLRKPRKKHSVEKTFNSKGLITDRRVYDNRYALPIKITEYEGGAKTKTTIQRRGREPKVIIHRKGRKPRASG